MTMTAATPPQWNSDTKRIVAVFLLATALVLLYISRSVIPQLVMAGVLAYLFAPTVDRLAKRGVPRTIGALVCLLLIMRYGAGTFSVDYLIRSKHGDELAPDLRRDKEMWRL